MTRRVLIALLSVTTIAVAAFFVPAALSIRRAQRRGELLALQRDASIVATQLAAIDRGNDSAALDVVATSRDRLGLYAMDGSLVAGVGPQRPDEITARGLMGEFAEGAVGSDLVAAVPVRVAATGNRFVLRIEAPSSESRARFFRSILLLGLAAIGVIAVAGLVGLWLARRLNRPVDELTAWAAAGRTDRSPPGATGIGALDALRTALIDDRTRIEELLRRERSFSSQVSHQLRTPVAAMRIAIETEVEAPRDDSGAVLHETLGQLDRLESTINSLLALARHTDRERTHTDVLQVVSTRVAEWGRRAAPAGRAVVLVGAPVTMRVDVEALGHIVDVLLDNALVHGRGQVTVTVRAGNPGCSVDVTDEGRPPEDRDPFADVGTDTSHGIGLRLARSLAEQCGDRLSMVRGSATTFRLTLHE